MYRLPLLRYKLPADSNEYSGRMAANKNLLYDVCSGPSKAQVDKLLCSLKTDSA